MRRNRSKVIGVGAALVASLMIGVGARRECSKAIKGKIASRGKRAKTIRIR